MDDGGGYQPRREKETTAVDAIGGDPDEMWQFRRSLLKSLGRGRPATQAVQRALELSRHPMLGGPRDGATKSLPQTRPGGNPDPRDPAPVTTVVQSIIGGLSARPHRAE